jgi:dTMP kinase
MRGKFITLEGSEGAGKSTNLAFIQHALEQMSKQVVVTREPGGTPLGEEIRHLLLHYKGDVISSDAELLLMFAARAQHIAQVIEPALQAGKYVLCDRFTDATYAYQGGGRGIEQQHISVLEQWVQQELRPDLTIYLDVPVEIGLDRAGQRSDPDRFESEARDFFDRVRQAYLELARSNPQRYRVVDASQPLEAVQTQISKVLEEL